MFEILLKKSLLFTIFSQLGWQRRVLPFLDTTKDGNLPLYWQGGSADLISDLRIVLKAKFMLSKKRYKYTSNLSPPDMQMCHPSKIAKKSKFIQENFVNYDIICPKFRRIFWDKILIFLHQII